MSVFPSSLSTLLPSNTQGLSMEKRPTHNRRRPSSPTHHTPSPPIVVWSNSAYSLDDQSSVASDTPAVAPYDHESNQRWLPFTFGRITEEELRLREELEKEIENELERELMEGILALVRRLGNLKAQQITRYDHRADPFYNNLAFNVGSENSANRRFFLDTTRSRHHGGIRDLVHQCSDAESSMTSFEQMKHEQRGRRERWH